MAKIFSGRADVLVYTGQYTEAVFVKSLLEGSGIAVAISSLSESGDDDVGVHVARVDVNVAMPLVEDFRNHGTRTPKLLR